MTVAPAWPQDGNRQPKGVDSGVELDDRSDSPALPPTLFKLPNLNPAPQPPRGMDDPPRSPTPPAVEPATGVSATAVASSTPTATPPASPSAAPESKPKFSEAAPPEPPKAAAPRTPSSERAPLLADRPAGRSWVETIGSHGVVVVLLLIVVTAALVTGRGSKNHEIDASLAESDELLDFSDGTEFELPLPNHGSDESTGFTASADIESSTTDQDATLSALESEVSASSMVTAAGIGATPASNSAAEPSYVATLDAPHSSSANVSGASEPDSTAQLAVNRYSSRPLNVDAVAASSRLPAESGASTLPTLEDLADDPSSTREQGAIQTTGPARILSKTPAAINDWLRYLPAYEFSQPAGSEIPSNSK